MKAVVGLGAEALATGRLPQDLADEERRPALGAAGAGTSVGRRRRGQGREAQP